MTEPRQILPGSFYFITRSCTQQQFFLNPCTRTNHLVRYVFALAAEKSGVELHAICVMSNHYHAVVSDPLGRLPEFMQLAHQLIAKSQNAALERSENFWSSDEPNAARLISEKDVLESMAYVIANPTAAGLVKSPHEWPGLITRYLGESHEVEMPDFFFDGDGDLDDTVTLSFVRPCIFQELSDCDLNRRLFEEVATLVREARKARAQAGMKFLGVNAVLQQSFNARPKTTEHRYSVGPRVISSNPSLRARAFASLKMFTLDYSRARIAWRAGNHNQVFPAGTYALRIQAGVNCEECVPI